jgi:DNA-binding LytR/AlgR family response regulator
MIISCIIIDDEPVARKGIEGYIKKISFLQLAGSYSHPDKIDTSLLPEIDLIFLDIRLHKSSGLDFYRQLKPDAPFAIVISAYPEHAIDGFELNVVDYLLKPATFERFEEAVNRVKEIMELKENNRAVYDVPSDYFFIKSNNQIQKLNYEDILYIEGLSNYVVIHTVLKKFLSYISINLLMEKLPKGRFVRIHKSYVVAVDKIEAIKANEILLKQINLPISKSYKNDFMEMVEGKLFKK